MYVWLRMGRMVATAKTRGPYAFGEPGRLSFRCLPSDIDTNMHLNNARYMMLADLGRIDIFVRSGLLKAARENGWAPMLGGLQAVFVREIRLWRRFTVSSSIETWDGSQVLGKHVFTLEDGKTAAIVTTTAGVYDRRARRFVEIDTVLAGLGRGIVPRPPSEAERAFLASHRGLRAMAKGDA